MRKSDNRTNSSYIFLKSGSLRFLEPLGPVIGVYLDGFTFSFYVFSSILGYKLGFKIIFFDSWYAQGTSLPQSFQRGVELTNPNIQ